MDYMLALFSHFWSVFYSSNRNVQLTFLLWYAMSFHLSTLLTAFVICLLNNNLYSRSEMHSLYGFYLYSPDDDWWWTPSWLGHNFNSEGLPSIRNEEYLETFQLGLRGMFSSKKWPNPTDFDEFWDKWQCVRSRMKSIF